LHLLKAEQVAIMIEALLGETALDNIKAFVHAVPLAFQRHAVGVVLVVSTTSDPHPEFESAPRDEIKGSNIFGHTQGMVERQNHDKRLNPDAEGSSGYSRQHRKLRR